VERTKSTLQRCAIYTRKSSEEGLEQDFNSLHAQREACEAFVKSQQGEGWRLVKRAYDDGGLSGGTMERPALQQLLDDIREGQVDVVVVYKVDRLTRSLADFAKMVEVFDARGVSFVAVTQQFNTTTSMGRLTLNVLLSFAQFEREVTGERIRDKIAASKRKGMWMGGCVPLGYDLRDRKVVINEAEAKTVQEIFKLYLELGSVRLLKDELARRGIMSKLRISKGGIRTGGQAFFRGALYAILSNPIYIGEIRHKKLRHPGQHEPIVERVVWEKAQEKLLSQTNRTGASSTKCEASPLAGKLFDERGQRLTPSHAVKNGRRYRYYASRNLAHGRNTANDANSWRIPAREIESSVISSVRKVLEDRTAILEAIQSAEIAPRRIPSIFETATALSRNQESGADPLNRIARLVDRVDLRQDGIQLSITFPLQSGEDDAPKLLHFKRFIPMQVKRRGVEMRLVIAGGFESNHKTDPSLFKAVARAHRWFEEIAQGSNVSFAEIARRERVTSRYVRRLLPLAFLDPGIVEAIAEGRQPSHLTAETLTRKVEIAVDWKAQRQRLELQ
jgi:site-specific DNA recombinase